MNFSHRIRIFFLLAWTLWIAPSQAQNTDTDTSAPPPGGTIIDSKVLSMDQTTHTSVFTGDVVVVSTNFKMTCQEMTVISDKDGKIINILAKGDVVITQPGRIAHCGQAQYFHDTDTFVLTDQPRILDNNNELSAPIITMNRTNQTMITSGGPSHMKMINGIDSTPPSPPVTGPLPNK